MAEDEDVHWNDSPVTSNWAVKQKFEDEEEERDTSVQEMFVEMILVRLDKFPSDDKFITALKSVLLDSKRSSKHFRKKYQVAGAIDAVLGGWLLQQEQEIHRLRQFLKNEALNPASALFRTLNIHRGFRFMVCVITRKGLIVRWKYARSLRKVHKILDQEQRDNSVVYMRL